MQQSGSTQMTFRMKLAWSRCIGRIIAVAHHRHQPLHMMPLGKLRVGTSGKATVNALIGSAFWPEPGHAIIPVR